MKDSHRNNCENSYQNINENNFPEAGVRIPKNIRQIGAFGDTYKIYVEDFVYTYVHQILHEKKTSADEVVAAVLLGEIHTVENNVYVFISGAQRCDFSLVSETEESDPVMRQQQFWGSVYQNLKAFFSEKEILGWYISLEGDSGENVPRLQQFFEATAGRGSRFLYYEDALDQDAEFFVLEQHTLQPAGGYAVYYEKNPQMQEYMISERESMRPQGQRFGEQIEDVEDVAQNYRAIISKVNEKSSHKRTQPLVYVAGVAVLVVVTATGITQIGNYQNLKMLENTLQTFSGSQQSKTAKTLTEDVVSTKTAPDSKNASEKDTDSDTNNGTKTASKNTTATDEKTASKNTTATDEKSASKKTSETDSKTDVATKTTGSTSKTDANAKITGNISKSDADTKNTSGSASDTTTKNTSKTTSDTAAKTTSNTATKSSSAKQEYYIVRKGDSLVSISRKYYGNIRMVEKICKQNHIENENKIYEGQKLKLPSE